MLLALLFVGGSLFCSFCMLADSLFHPRWAYKKCNRSKFVWFLAALVSFPILMGIPMIVLYELHTARKVRKVNAANVQAFHERHRQQQMLDQAVYRAVQRSNW